MKTGQDVVDDVRAEITEPSPTFFSEARMLQLVNLAQEEYVRLTRVLQSYAFTSSIQGQADYPMPTDWLGSEKIFFNATTDGVTPNWQPLQPTTLEKLGQENPNFLSASTSTQGTPRLCYVIGSTLYIYPKPQANGQNDIFMFYESRAPELGSLDDPLSIDDSLYPGVRAYVLWKLWKQDQEKDNAAEEKENFKDELGRGRKWRNKRMLDGVWKMDVQSYIPYSYSGSFSNQSGTNPLNQ